MAIATAVTGLVGGASQFFAGQSMQNKAQDAIDNFRWQELKNPYNSLQVSTLGSDLRKNQATANTAMSLDAVRSAGARGALGSVGKIQAQNNMVNAQIGAELDEQQKRIDYAGAQYETKKQDMIEKRQSDELQGYGQMMNTGMNMKWNGIGSGINSIGMLGQTQLGQGIDNKITKGLGFKTNSGVAPQTQTQTQTQMAQPAINMNNYQQAQPQSYNQQMIFGSRYQPKWQ